MASQTIQKVLRKVGLRLAEDGYGGGGHRGGDAMGRLPSGELESSIRGILEASDYEVRQTIILTLSPLNH